MKPVFVLPEIVERLRGEAPPTERELASDRPDIRPGPLQRRADAAPVRLPMIRRTRD